MRTEPNALRARLPEAYRLTTPVSAKIAPPDLEQIDRLAREAGVARSVMIRRLLAKGLESC